MVHLSFPSLLIYSLWVFAVIQSVQPLRISPTRSTRNSCPSLILSEGETISCALPGTGQEVNCVTQPIQKNTIAEVRCTQSWTTTTTGVGTGQSPKILTCSDSGTFRHYYEWFEQDDSGRSTPAGDNFSNFKCEPSSSSTIFNDRVLTNPDPDAEIFSQSKTSTSTGKPKSTTTTRSPITHETEETTMRHDYGKILPTRWPITSSKPKTETRTTTSTTRKPKLTTTAATTKKPAVAVSTLDPKVVGVFVCPPMQPITGVVFRCKHAELEETDDCLNGGMVGTKASLSCDNFYKTAYGQESTEVECQSNHRWSSHRMFGCNLECGISSRPRKSYIVNGVTSDRISWPWHATIFRKKDGDFYYICGGTLISKSVILTAAHCMTNPMTTTVSDFNDFRIILATKSSNYTENLQDSISGMNLFQVQNISIPNSYNGLTFEADIALVQLDRPVKLSDYVKPVCFPFQSKENSDIELLHLSPGTVGQTVGFGVDETGYLASVLKEIDLPVISHRDCGDALDRFPSHSQFCGGYQNGTFVCNGDSGGGIYFSEGTGIFNRFIIQGILSFGNSNREMSVQRSNCSEKSFAVFTKVGGFTGWVQQYLDKWEPDSR